MDLPHSNQPCNNEFLFLCEPGLVTVIIPTYNRAHLLSETISSVVAQDYRPIEIIVVDDGSTDNTSQLVSKWQHEIESTPGLALRYVFQSNRGAPAARNHGMRLSCGEFLQFLDSDDFLDTSKTRLHVDLLQTRPQADFAYGPIRELEHPEHTIYCQSEMSPQRMVYKQIVNPAFQTSGPLCRRSMFTKIGAWNEDIAPMEDWELFSRAAVMGCLGAYDSYAVVYHRMDVSDRLRWEGQTERLNQYLRGRFAHLESMLEHASTEFREDRKFRRLIAWQFVRVASEGVIRGWDGDFDSRVAQARITSKSWYVRSTTASLSITRQILGRHAAALFYLACSWIYFHSQGFLMRLRRAVLC